MNPIFTIATSLIGDVIVQEVSQDDPFTDKRDVLARSVINTQEAQLREALIVLGWTPPTSAVALTA